MNIKGVFYGIAAALPHMIRRKSGHVINVLAGDPDRALIDQGRFGMRTTFSL